MLVPAQELFLYVAFMAITIYAVVVMAQPPKLDIGFGRAENVALARVTGRVETIERSYVDAQPVFEVEVREDAGRVVHVVIDARDGHVLSVSN